MSNTFFSLPPPEHINPLLPEGGISPEWFMWLYQLFQASLSLTDLQKLEALDSTQNQEARALALQRLAVFEGQAPVDCSKELRKQTAFLSEIPVAAAKFEDIKKLVWLMADGREPKRLYIGTHAQRLVTYALSGALFFETDTSQLFVAVLGVWTAITVTGPTTFLPAMRTVTVGTAVTAADFTVSGNIAAGNVNFTLPAAAGVSTQIFALENRAFSGGTVTVVPNGAEKIDNVATWLLQPGESILIQSDSATWVILARKAVPPALSAICSATLTTTAAYQDVAGATVTLARAGLYLITGSADIGAANADGGTNVRLLAGGVAQNALMRASAVSGGFIEVTCAQTWIYQAAAGDIAKLQAKIDMAGGGGSSVQITNTSISAVWLRE